jgi:peptidoglycan/LPS O-acetylase OafA/YrhL
MKNTNNFDGLRLLGALFVLYSHQFPLSGRPEPLVMPGVTFGAFGVHMFFAISGYLVCQSWLADPNAHRFIERRFLRIWPGMAVALIVTAVLAALATDSGLWPFILYMRNLYCLRCDDGHFFTSLEQTTLYGPMWTIPLEVTCYTLLMVGGMLARGRLGLLVLTLTAAALLKQIIPPSDLALDLNLAGIHWPLGSVGAAFLAGCLLCFQPQLLRRAWLPILGGVALALGGHYITALAFIVPPAVVWIGLRSWPVLREAGRFGDLSYGVYLYAWAVQQLGVLWMGKDTSVWLLMANSLAWSLALAYASWHLVEKRALRFKPARDTAQPTAAAPAATRPAPP